MNGLGARSALLVAAVLCSSAGFSATRGPSFTAASRESRIAVAEVELTGPFDGATLEVPGQGFARIEGRLLAGEIQVLRVPVPTKAALTDERPSRLEPRVQLDSPDMERGRLRILRWLGAGSDGATAGGFDALPAGMRARPRPPIAAADATPGAAVLAWLAASFVVGFVLRRRPLPAFAFGCAAAAIAFAIGPSGDPSIPQRVTVEEGDAESATWLEVEAARGQLTILGAPDAVHVDSLPSGAVLECRAALSSRNAWEIAGRRAVLYRLATFEPGDRSFSRAANRWVDLEETWVRDDGAWSARGAWRVGAPLPEPVGGEAPPGWLAAGLPQGTSILLGRMRAGAGAKYVRMSGL